LILFFTKCSIKKIAAIYDTTKMFFLDLKVINYSI
jgi:hypothetical protein